MDLPNANQVFLIMGGLVALLGFVLALYGVITWIKRASRITTRIDKYAAIEQDPNSDPKASPIIAREVSGSLFSRTIGTAASKLIAFLGRYAPQKMIDQIEHLLIIADRPGNLTAAGFFTLRVLLLGLGILLAYLFNRDLETLNLNSLLFGILTIVVFWLLPMVWLRGKARARQDEILRGLPDALDMLSVCASAGLGFDQSLQRISQYWDTPLGHELQQVTTEMEMGVPRSEALHHMSQRLNIDDLTRFIATIVQAERIGMSYADVLHSQADQMRIMRQLRARELANKLPGKMIIPVALFIFPALMAVILGPAIPTLLGVFETL